MCIFICILILVESSIKYELGLVNKFESRRVKINYGVIVSYILVIKE